MTQQRAELPGFATANRMAALPNSDKEQLKSR